MSGNWGAAVCVEAATPQYKWCQFVLYISYIGRRVPLYEPWQQPPRVVGRAERPRKPRGNRLVVDIPGRFVRFDIT